MLTQRTEHLLEYPKIMENVASLSLSEEAAAIIKNSQPVYDNSVSETKEIVRVIYSILKTHSDEPRFWLPSIGFLIPKIETQGTVLDLDETLAIGLFIERSSEIKKWIIKDNENHEQEHSGKRSLFDLLENIPFVNCNFIAAEIFKIIDREGNFRDLPVLRVIRKRINNLEKQLKNTITRYSLDDDYKRMLQSPLPSQRDGRAVISVKANFRGRIRGIVHEVSASGQTVFVEPLDVVEKNNEILIEKRNLDAEIQKILRELTQNISIYSQDIKNLHLSIINFECLRARAKYSAVTNGHFTDNNENLILKQARHPMLKKAVPIDISMNNDTRALIVTGPNTGGKTVALKTLGLLVMMNQSALALPVDEGSILPIFDGIYADIGDEQSIDQSLSTFSAHIKNISAIIKHITKNSLVLLDELGSGTDPQEGTAIAMAVLDYLIEKKTRMIITTHHGILKHYGYTRQGVENASVEFDAQTLSPTYKIICGLPGESRALDIASANGLDQIIVANARKYLNEEKTDVSEMIKNLEQKQRELNRLEKKSVIEQNILKEEKRETDLKELRLRQKEAELKRGSIGKLQLFLQESRKTLENLVRELKEGEVNREKTLKVKDFLNELTRNVENESLSLTQEERTLKDILQKAKTKAALDFNSTFSPGMDVFAGSTKQRGTIIRADRKNTRSEELSWLVKIGSLKISFLESELAPADPIKPAKTSSWMAEYDTSTSAVFELKLLGKRLEDATEALRRQIEAASLSGLKNFSVIHGKGSGILQKGIHEYLKNDPAVADYYFSRPELGGFGRTEVVLG
ncbi:MAG: endonuclease MutS2 [Treponema sp.]|nr:endonuclease MutS2 [Treponema sp.]